MHETLGRAVPGPERGLRPRTRGLRRNRRSYWTRRHPHHVRLLARCRVLHGLIVLSPDATGWPTTSSKYVACALSQSCMAVGYTMSSSNVDQTYVLSNRGTGRSGRSSQVRTPRSPTSEWASLCAASRSPYRCGGTLPQRLQHGIHPHRMWEWEEVAGIATSPNHGKNGSILNAVSCAAVGSCTAVGESTIQRRHVSLAESSNGGHWSIASSPNSSTSLNYLNGVSVCSADIVCLQLAPTTTAPWRAGRRPRPGTESAGPWSRAWDVGSDGQTNTLQSVSCCSATSCTAVGSYTAQQSRVPRCSSSRGTG